MKSTFKAIWKEFRKVALRVYEDARLIEEGAYVGIELRSEVKSIGLATPDGPKVEAIVLGYMEVVVVEIPPPHRDMIAVHLIFETPYGQTYEGLKAIKGVRLPRYTIPRGERWEVAMDLLEAIEQALKGLMMDFSANETKVN